MSINGFEFFLILIIVIVIPVLIGKNRGLKCVINELLDDNMSLRAENLDVNWKYAELKESIEASNERK